MTRDDAAARPGVRSRLRQRLRRIHDDRGMTLVEVIVSLSLITIVMSATGLFIAGSLKSQSASGVRQQATSLADRYLESVQAVRPTDLLDGRTQADVTTLLGWSGAATYTANDWVSGGNYDPTAASGSQAWIPTSQTATVNSVQFTIRTFIDLCTLQANGSCIRGTSQPSGNSMMYRATVVVTAPAASSCASSGCPYSVSTLIDPHQDPRFNSNISRPTITAVSPATVPAGQTKTLTLTGTGFVNGAIVSISTGGGTVGTVSQNTGTSVTVALTAGGAGTYTLALTNPDGGRATIAITVTGPPTITSITPSPARGAQTTALTITGTGLQSGASVSVSGGSVSSLIVSPTTSATVQYTGPGAGGSITLTWTNPDGGQASKTFTVQSAPYLTTPSPTTVPVNNATPVTVPGGYLATGATVSASSGTLSGVTVSATSLGFTLTAPTAGTVTITLTNPDGGIATTTVTVQTARSTPVVTGLSPTTFTGGQSTKFTVSGSGFVSGATVTLTAYGQTYYSGAATYVNSGKLTFTFTPPNVYWQTTATATLTVTNPDGGTGSNNFTVTIQ